MPINISSQDSGCYVPNMPKLSTFDFCYDFITNKYSIIHCKNNTIEWEQFPILPRIMGRRYGIQEPIISIAPTKECVRIVVILGKPNCITGLDEGVFRSIHKYDENFINVMSETRFKEL